MKTAQLGAGIVAVALEGVMFKESMSYVNFAANRIKVSYEGRGPRGSEVLMLSLGESKAHTIDRSLKITKCQTPTR